MPTTKMGLKISRIIIVLSLIAALIPAVNADVWKPTPVCCPVFADYPDYPYPIDPYYMFPVSCACPFLNASLARFEKYPAAYWEYIIQTQDSSCTNCSGSSPTGSFSYSNMPLIIPQKDSVMTDYSKISVKTSIISKNQALSKYLN